MGNWAKSVKHGCLPMIKGFLEALLFSLVVIISGMIVKGSTDVEVLKSPVLGKEAMVHMLLIIFMYVFVRGGIWLLGKVIVDFTTKPTERDAIPVETVSVIEEKVDAYEEYVDWLNSISESNLSEFGDREDVL